MANQTRDASFRSVIDRFTRELTAVISRQVEEQVSAALSRIQVGGGARGHLDGRRYGGGRARAGEGAAGGGPAHRAQGGIRGSVTKRARAAYDRRGGHACAGPR